LTHSIILSEEMIFMNILIIIYYKTWGSCSCGDEDEVFWDTMQCCGELLLVLSRSTAVDIA